LTEFGIQKGDRIAIVLPNGVENISTFLAVSEVATAAPLNSSYKFEEFQFYFDDTKAKTLITFPSNALEAIEAMSGNMSHITVGFDGDGQLNFQLERKGLQSDTSSPPSDPDVALVLHTSGTTSRPKRVPLTHFNLLTSMRNIVETYALSKQDVSLCVMPLFHVHGLIASTLSTLQSGGTVVVPPRFNPLGFWPLVEKFNVTWFSAVPSMHQALLARSKNNQPNIPPSLRFIRSCSAALPPNTMRELEERFAVPVLEAYGMTEAAHQMASNPLPPFDRMPGSVGPGTGVEIGIMDELGNLLHPEQKGEVVIKGNNVTHGYEDNPNANEDSFTKGWFRTGDEGHIESTGYLTLTGRIKELINRSGEKISPREIDEVLLDHPEVIEAVAFGVPHATHGEEPAAVVVLNNSVPPGELVTYCRTRLADFKCPRVIRVVSEIPKGATGKLQRRFVAEAFLKMENS
jgi:acyl-CoA synthetase (AMP-forming)/AMP-acid ligase II